jgi:signal transduction histidine kinase
MEDLSPSHSVDALNSLGFRDILEQDSRPTFVIDLDPDEDFNGGAHAIAPIWCNAALRTHESLLDAILGHFNREDYPSETDIKAHHEFKVWATGWTEFDDSRDVFPLTYVYSGILWTGSTVQKRWRLVSGNLIYQTSQVAPRDLSAGPPSEVATGGLRVNHSSRSSSQPTASRKDPGWDANVSQQMSNSRSNNFKTASKTTFKSSTNAASSGMTNPTKMSSSGSTDGTSNSNPSINLSVPENGIPDWTVKKPKGPMTPYMTFARSIDWSATPLGAMGTWTKEFRQVANLMMGSPHPAALFWGNELTMLYNEAYALEVAGTKHPVLMGTGFSGPFAETWDSVGPIFAECARTGLSVRKENQMLPIERSGYVEETFFSWSFTPLYGGSSRILGFYNTPFETTSYCIGSRRMETLRRLGEAISLARTVKKFWQSVLEGLEDNHFDVPFALLYSVVDGDGDEESSHSSGSAISLKSCIYEGSLGVPDGHPAAPHKLDLKRSLEGFIPSFREAMRTREPTKLQTKDGTLPEALLEGINWRGFGKPCREAVIFPVRPTNGESVLAFLLLGVNPLRAYDEEYKAFTTMLNRQLATSLASVILFEDEVRRFNNAAEAAAAEQEQLTQQLAVQTSRLRRMAALSPLGMFFIDPNGLLREANDRWFEMTGHPRENFREYSFFEPFTESSRVTAQGGWAILVSGEPWSGELQLNKLTHDPLALTSEPIDYWVLATAQPELAEDGSLRSVMGSLTDISHLKWAQGLQNRRLHEAEETRRQQNEFIDITSHEMRNPLSAILQCSDDITTSLEEFQATKKPPTAAVIESCIEASNTIALCVQHQKSIVDDILTISKLDSNLLTITPTPVQPVTVVKRTLKIFEPELLVKNIKISFEQHQSLAELHIDWVTLDPSRLLQIMINLVSNAIKFTDGSLKRHIKVSIGASIGPPIVQTPGFEYVPMRNPSTNITLGDDWGTGEIIHLRFKVEDTGCGLKNEEKHVLFQRFSQASPRTHAVYGGSGLGLFVSLQL